MGGLYSLLDLRFRIDPGRIGATMHIGGRPNTVARLSRHGRWPPSGQERKWRSPLTESCRRSEPPGRPEKAAWIGLLFALSICLIVVLMVLAPFFSVILLAVVAAGLIAPSYNRLVGLLNGHRKAAAFVICVILLVTLMVPVYLIAQEVSKEALGVYELSTTQLTEGRLRDVLEDRQDRIDQVNALLEPFGIEMTVDRAYELLATAGVRIGGFFYKQGVSLAKHLVRFVFSFIFWVVILYYLLVDGSTFRNWMEDTLPLPRDEQRLVSHRFMDMASSLVIGNGVAALIQGLAGVDLLSAARAPRCRLVGRGDGHSGLHPGRRHFPCLCAFYRHSADRWRDRSGDSPSSCLWR